MQAAATVIAGGLIAAAIVLTNHWSVVVLDRTPPLSALRLDRWTGAVVVCGGLRRPFEWDCPVQPPSAR
jgi:hypothetical protein